MRHFVGAKVDYTSALSAGPAYRGTRRPVRQTGRIRRFRAVVPCDYNKENGMKFASGFFIGMLAVALAFAQTGNRRVTQNKLSPPADTSMKLQGHTVTIEYNAPSARGRKVEGGLIPYGRWWRLGADSATTLTSDADIMIGDLRVPKGVHTLYLIAAGDNDWKLIVNKQTGQWGTTYKESEDLGRVALTLAKLPEPAETLKITLTPAGDSEGTLTIAWGQTQSAVPLKLA